MKPVSREAAIENWMRSTVASDGIDRYDDLHVDQIDAAWRPRSIWIDAGLEAFHTAQNVRDRLSLPVSIALAFSLRVGEVEPKRLDFETLSKLKDCLDASPPSLYVFHVGKEPWRLPSGNELPFEFYLRTLSISSLWGANVRASGCYFIEFRQTPTAESARTVFVAA